MSCQCLASTAGFLWTGLRRSCFWSIMELSLGQLCRCKRWRFIETATNFRREGQKCVLAKSWSWVSSRSWAFVQMKTRSARSIDVDTNMFAVCKNCIISWGTFIFRPLSCATATHESPTQWTYLCQWSPAVLAPARESRTSPWFSDDCRLPSCDSHNSLFSSTFSSSCINNYLLLLQIFQQFHPSRLKG